MEAMSIGRFHSILVNKKGRHPLIGQIELTYRCGLNCVHCYCKGSEDEGNELTASQWKRILNELQKEGCVYLVFTGGDPLLKEDFLELYSYAKSKGFVITIFSNAQAMTEDAMDYLSKYPPRAIEITLNGITRKTYEAITQVKGSFSIVMKRIKKIKDKKLPLVLKANCLKQNKKEIGRIKAFADKFLGKPKRNRYYFKYDPMIYPCLDGEKRPTNFRLSFKELLEVRKEDADIWREYQKCMNADIPDFDKDKRSLYWCDVWNTRFFIDPYGRLKFCVFSEKFSVDLKKVSFRDGFYKIFPKILDEKFKTESKCKDCGLRRVCHRCPARAYLETADEEAPVPYYCELAMETAKGMRNRTLLE